MHGDYEMRFSDLPDDCILRDTNTVVYGAVLHTSLNGTSKDYGLRYQENIFHHKKIILRSLGQQEAVMVSRQLLKGQNFLMSLMQI